MINIFHLVSAFDKAKPNLFNLKFTSIWYGVFIVGKAVNVFGQNLHGNSQYHFVLSMQPIHCHFFCCCCCCYRYTILYYICILYCVFTPSQVSFHHYSSPLYTLLPLSIIVISYKPSSELATQMSMTFHT